MRPALIAAALLLAGCASDPKEEAAKDRERSQEEIRRMIEEVIVAMRDNRPEIYFERLCRAQRDAYPLAEVREDWNQHRALIEQMAGSMTVKLVKVDEADPNIATALISAPNHPKKDLMFLAIRENGAWKIREARLD